MHIDWDKSKTRIPPTTRIDATVARARLYGRLRQYRLDTDLAFINRVFVTYANPDLRARLPSEQRDLWLRAIQPHQLANLAKMLIEVSNDHRGKDLTWNELALCVNAWHDLQGATPSENYSLSDWEAFLLRTAFQQFPLQRSPGASLPRSIQLFDRIARRPEFSEAFDIPSAFEKLTGLSFQDAAIYAIWWWIRCGMDTARRPFVERHEFVRPDLSWASEDRIQRFLNFVATDYGQFRVACSESELPEPYLAVYAHNPLEARPIVETRRSGYVLPIPPYLMDRVGMSVYYDLIKAHGNSFSNVFGKVFEAYVGDLLREVYPGGQILPELAYGARGDSLSSDWAVIEGTAVTLMECKITRLWLTTKTRGAAEDLRADLPRGLARAVAQLYRVATAIKERQPGLERLHELDTVIPVVVLLDNFYLANTPYIRELVAAQLQQEVIEDFEYHVIGIEDLEDYLHAARELGLAKLLQQKMSEKDRRWHSQAYLEFWQYVEATAPGSRKRSPLLRQTWTQLFLAFRDRFPELRDVPMDEIVGADE